MSADPETKKACATESTEVTESFFPFSDLPIELKEHVLNETVKLTRTARSFDALLVCMKVDFAMAKTLRLVNKAISEMRKVQQVLYATAWCVWSVEDALKCSWRPSMDLMEMMMRTNNIPQIQHLSFTKDREAWNAMFEVTDGNPKMLRQFLAKRKERYLAVIRHMRRTGVWAPVNYRPSPLPNLAAPLTQMANAIHAAVPQNIVEGPMNQVLAALADASQEEQTATDAMVATGLAVAATNALHP